MERSCSMQPGRETAERSGMNGLTPDQLGVLRHMLETKRDELRRKHDQHVASATHGADERSEPMDIANQAANEAQLLEIAARERAVLLEIEAALLRIERGTYGIAESTGGPISLQRLLAVPWARNDAQAEELLERR